MRVISQNGTIDIPYEMTAFHLAGGMIHMNMVGDTGKGTLMAQYETLEKAEKAMEMLHKAYTGIMPSLVIDKNAKFDEESMEALINSTAEVWVKPANVGDVEVHMLPRIFQFPVDEEIEVEE